MKRLLPLLFILLSASQAFAQNTSTVQMQLAGPNSATFTNRLQYLMEQNARTVLTEAATDATHGGTNTGADATDRNYTTGCHTLRWQYAATVISNPATTASNASVLIAGANFADSVVVGSVVVVNGLADSSVSDLALTAAIQHDWSTLAKCFTNP